MSTRALVLPVWRVQVARALAWGLMLAGWVGLGGLAQTLGTGPRAGLGLMALWLLAIGVFTESIARWRPKPAVLLALMACAAVSMLWSPHDPMPRGGVVRLLPLTIGWALAVALASASVRACRSACVSCPPPPLVAAAVGAVLAWVCVGDISDVSGLRLRMLGGAIVALALLAMLMQRGPARASGCRAALFDCSLPSWSGQAWRQPQRWPVALAALVMVPMMCGLPIMVSLCRSNAASPPVVLGLHFTAMFVPALLIGRRAWLPDAAPAICAWLLALGAVALVSAPEPLAWWCVAVAHGTAWSVAWAAGLSQRGARREPCGASALAGAALNSLAVLALGLGLQGAGLGALSGVHVGLGASGAVAALGGLVLALRRPPRVPLTGQ